MKGFLKDYCALFGALTVDEWWSNINASTEQQQKRLNVGYKNV